MNKRLFASALSLFSILGTIIPVYATNNVELKYALAETEGEIVFHLDNTSIVYDDENLEQDINYHITTTAGNYYLDNESVKNYFYFVEAEETSLSDSHGSSTTIPVEFDHTNAEGTLDLTKTVTDNTTYAGAIGTAIEKEEKAGTYVGRTTILFDAFIPIMSESTGFSYVNRNEESIIVDYDASYGSDITIPDEFEGNTVTEINDQALMSKSLKSVSLSSGVKSIGDEALANNTELTTIELNEGLESIGDKAMANTAVEEVVIPSTVEVIGEEALVQETPTLMKVINRTGRAFDWSNITSGTSNDEFIAGPVDEIDVINDKKTDSTCFTYKIENEEVMITDYNVACGGTDINIPSEIEGYPVTSIGQFSFDNKGLTSVIVPGSVKIIGTGAFQDNATLTKVTLNEGLEEIGKQAFWFTDLSELTTPSTLISIGDAAFKGNENLTTVTLNNGLKTIGEQAFEGDGSLTSLTLGEGLETISGYAFKETSITKFEAPSTLKTIGKWAFSDIANLTTVTLNEGLETIDINAFRDSKIVEITIPSTVTTINKFALATSGDTLKTVINKTGRAFSWENIVAVVTTETDPFINGTTTWGVNIVSE